MENKKIVDYIIITFEQEHLVVIEVLNKIKDGYIPLGGVSMAVDSGKISTFKYFVQAMVKYSDN
jgi:hypothetical protein